MRNPLSWLLYILGSMQAATGQIPEKSDLATPESASIYRLIEKADSHFEKQEYDSALSFAAKAAAQAKSRNLQNAQGWALVRVAEVLIEQQKLSFARETALQVHKLSNLANDTLLNGVALLLLGQVKMYDDQPDEAILLIDKSIAGGLGVQPNPYLALAFNELGYAWGQKDEYERQAQFTHKSLSIYEQLKNEAGMAMALGNLSTIYYRLGQKEKAIEYGKQSLGYRKKTGDIIRLGITCCNLSQYYLGIDTLEAAKYQDLCVKYARQSGDESRIIQAYITSALIANARKNNKEAFEYELKVIEMLEKSRANEKMLARRYIAAAIYTDILRYDTAVTLGYYQKSLRLSNRLGDRGNLRDIYLYLSDYYKKSNNYPEAYATYKKHILYRDSLINLDKEEKIAELENRYEANKKDNEIAKLNNEQRIKQLEIEKQKAIIAGNTTAALKKQNEIDLLSKSRELQGVRIRQQEEALVKNELIATASRQQLELAEKEKQLQEKSIRSEKALRNLLVGGLVLVLLLGYAYFNRYQLQKKLEQQKSLLMMRNNISRDLHDDIGASLSNINILNEMARRTIHEPAKSKEYLLKASEDIQRISESLSDIVWNINPKYDEVQNLFIRMKRYAADMLDGKNIRGRFDFPPDDMAVRLSMTQRRDLYLLFKEAVNNLVKYSGATEALIRLQGTRHAVLLRVDDNGMGFDRSRIKPGNGLYNMEQRALASGGSLLIESAPGKGTVIQLEMKIA